MGDAALPDDLRARPAEPTGRLRAGVPATPTRGRPAAAPRRPLAGLSRFFALPVENFSTRTGQHTNAVYGFTSMLINVLRDEQPTHVAVAFDISRQTFRMRGVRRVQGQPLQVAREF